MSQEELYILDPTTSAKEMRNVLRSIANILKQYSIITESGFASLIGAADQLLKFRNESAWQLSIERETPIEFQVVENIYNETDPVSIILCSEGINIDFNKKFPFIDLDICIVIRNLDEEPVSRWHFDLANKQDEELMQPGPLTHVQFGGHNPGFRHLDHPLKIPRWNHPPMDIVLLCEAVVSNFFPNKWDLIREDTTWCDAISTSQRICYSSYLEKMIKTLGCRSTTILHEMDANIWSKSLNS